MTYDPFELSDSDSVLYDAQDDIPFVPLTRTPRVSKGSGSGDEVDAPGPLDKKGNCSFRDQPLTGWRDEKGERFRWVQEGARIAFAGTNVARCGCVAAKSRVAGHLKNPVVRLGRIKETCEGVAKDTYTCDNGTVCPYCGRQRARQRREALQNVLAFYHTEQFRMGFLTLTHSHDADDKLADTLDLFSARVGRLISPAGRSAKSKKKWRASQGWHGSFATFECPVSARNGFHFHGHFILVFQPGTTDEQMSAVWRDLRAEWISSCEADGFEADERFQNFKFVFDAEGIAAYSAKGAHWEMTSSHMKRAKNGSRSITQVLEDIAEHRDPRDIALMREYHAATKNRQMFRAYGACREHQAGILKAEKDLRGDINTFEETCSIDAEIFKEVCARGGRPALLHAATKDVGAVMDVLAVYGFPNGVGVFAPGKSEPAGFVKNSRLRSKQEKKT